MKVSRIGRDGVRYEHHSTVNMLLHRKLSGLDETVKFRVGTLNVGTMRGRAGEVVETLTRRHIDICCVQEVRWRGASVRSIIGKDSMYKFFWVGNSLGTGGVGILLAEKWIDKVIAVNRVNDRIMVIKLITGKSVVPVVSVYAPQSGLDDSLKDLFYDNLLAVVSKLGEKEIVLVSGDLNRHVGTSSSGYEGVHGGFGYGTRNPEGERILEFSDATEMIVANTMFKKRDSRLVTYKSGNMKGYGMVRAFCPVIEGLYWWYFKLYMQSIIF